MGYGNPLFDGDVPLASEKPRRRGASMWITAFLASTLSEGSVLPDRHQGADRRADGAESRWSHASDDSQPR